MEDTLPTQTIETMFLPPCGWCDVKYSAYDICEVHLAERLLAKDNPKVFNPARQLYSDHMLISRFVIISTPYLPCFRLYTFIHKHFPQPEKD